MSRLARAWLFVIALWLLPEGLAVGQDGELLNVYFLDVGQGDATLIKGRNVTILIDAGRHDRRDVVPHLRALGVERLDLLIITHPHADHIGQCADVVEAFPVREVWMSPNAHTSLAYERCLDAVLASDAGYFEPRAWHVEDLGDVVLEVVHPGDRLSEDLNDDSVSVRIVHGDVRLLFTGDAYTTGELAMIGRGHDLRAQVLQLGHHGSRTSSGPAFLEAVRPAVAVYSAGADNPYGHPHEEVIRRLRAFDVQVYGTGVHGTIRVTSDKKVYAVEPSSPHPVEVPAPPSEAAVACMPGQIDVNSAPPAELTKIVHIGPARAKAIVEGRPWTSLADLERIAGITAQRQREIVEQGLACVGP